MDIGRLAHDLAELTELGALRSIDDMRLAPAALGLDVGPTTVGAAVDMVGAAWLAWHGGATMADDASAAGDSACDMAHALDALPADMSGIRALLADDVGMTDDDLRDWCAARIVGR